MRLSFPRPGPPRVIAVTATVALATGAVGWAAGTQLKSPADAAASHRPPPASQITVPVEERRLTATVTGQGTVTYGAPQPVTLIGSVAATGDGADGAATAAALVTRAPQADRMLREGDVLLEVSGRPVFVMTGKVPMYRTLTRGGTGDDVRQLRAALRRLLPARGIAASGPLDDPALNALAAWYDKKGYQAAGPTSAQRTRLRELEQAAGAKQGGQGTADAAADLREFKKTYGVNVPSGEVLFLPKLPVRLTSVSTKPGATATGTIATVADPRLIVTGDIATEDSDLVKVGMAATLTSAAGDFTAKLTRLGAAAQPRTATPAGGADQGQPPGGSAEGAPSEGSTAKSPTGTAIQLAPEKPDKLKSLAGQPFKITIKVGGTDRAVLAVPAAALYTASTGQARLSVQDAAGQIHDVPVTPGLTADGYVEVTPADGSRLKAGDRVVVGVG
ncbi:hypothetical protein AB0M36_01925 [Actinoplanes sp. NPDC051346]|uniref:hypothetical protein n=1 Tax=Actinoplanes sp. NPDC051346 TaxID=3155048 RepID=UPI0034496AC6